MIQEVDQSLKELLLTELKRIPDSTIASADQITFLPPISLEEHPPKKSQINLYLHDVKENLSLREHERVLAERIQNEDSVKRRRAPIRLDLAYLITVYAGDDPGAEHRLLTEVLGVLLRARVLPEKYMTEALRQDPDNGVLLSVAQPDHTAHRDPAVLWQALGGRLRPTLGLVATATFNPYETFETRLVREAILALGVGVPPDGPQRPLSVKTTRVSAAGVVCDSGGNVLTGVSVQVKGREKTVRTDERGFFYVLDLPAGRATLAFRLPGFKTIEVATNVPPVGRPDLLEPIGVTLTATGEEERTVELRERAIELLNSPGIVDIGRKMEISVSGRLAFASGKPAAFVMVRAGNRETTTDADGFYAFQNLKETVKTVTAMVPGVGEVSVTPSDSVVALPPREEVAEKPKAKK